MEKSSLKAFTTTLKNKIEDLSPEFLYYYFSFQFDYWDNKQTTNEMSITWIIGPKAFKRWEDKNDKWKYFVSQGLWRNEKYNLNFFHFKKLFQKMPEVDYVGLKEKEEFQKALYFNQEVGFKNCCNNTTLINPNSSVCQACNFKTQCLKLLKFNYPTIHKMRYEVQNI